MAEVGALRITLGLDSVDFTQGMQNVNRRITALNSEFRAITAGSARFDNSLDALRNRSDVLTRTLQTHRLKVEELRRKYEESAAATGENSDETLRAQTAYNTAVAAMRRTEQQLTSTNRLIQQQTNSFSQLETQVNASVNDITRQMRLLESRYDAARAGVEDFGAETDQLRTRQEHLTNTMQLHSRRVEELTRLHQESAREKGADAQETQELEIRLNRARQAMRETETQLRDTTNQIEEQTNRWRRLSSTLNDTSERLRNTGEKLRSAGQTATAAVTVPLIAAGGAMVKMADNFDSANGRIQARLGVTADRAKELGGIAEEVWKENFGENLQEVGDGLTTVSRNMKNLSDDQLEQATKSAYFLARAFDADLNESTRAAGQLMKDFGDTSDKAFDLVTWGFQNGLDYTGEFLDTIREYSPQFAEMGYSSEQFLNTLKSGFDAGAWSLDKIGDSIKESHLRMGALDKATVEAYESMGLNAEKYVKRISKGGKEGNKAFQEIVKKLMEVDDATERNALSTALFGTQYEDLREKVIFSMAGAEKSIKGLEGTTERASKAIQDNFGDRLSKVWRDFQSDMRPVGEALLDIAEDILPKIADKVKELADKFAGLSPEAKETALMIAGIAAAAGPALVVIGAMSSGIGLLTKGVSLAVGAIGGSAGLGAAFSALTGPVGLAIGGLALATGAVVAIKDSTEEAKKVNLEHAESLVEQINSLEDLTGKYEGLRSQNKLTNDELLRFRDIQSELKTATSAEEIKRLKDEAAKLQEKSGLSNKELSTMLSLNDQLIEKVPTAGQAFSEQGNSILNNTEDIKAANESLRENLRLELDIQRTKAQAQLDTSIRDRITAIEELNGKIKELNDAQISSAGKLFELEEMRKKQQEAYAAGQDAIAEGMNNDIQRLEQELHIQNQNVEAVAGEVEEKRKSVEKSSEQIAKTQEIYDKLINLQLAQAGINAKGQEGLSQLDEAISKTQTRISELNKIDKAQGGLNEKQRTELSNLQEAIGRYRTTKGEIQGIQKEQETVNSKIKDGTKKAGEMSDILSKSEVKDIKFTGDDYGKAKRISDEADKDVKKKVDVDDDGKAKKITTEAEKKVTKGISFTAANAVKDLVPSFISVPIKFIGDAVKGWFAEGTRNAPGGLSVVGEEGRELLYSNQNGFALATGPSVMNLSKGTRVIPNSDTEAILRNWNIPMKAAGVAQKVLGGIQGFERYNSSPVNHYYEGMLSGAIFNIKEELDMKKAAVYISREIARNSKQEARFSGVMKR